MNNERQKTVFLGVFFGAIIGAAFAWFISEEVDYDDEDVTRGIAKLGASDYFSLAMSLFTLARQFSDKLR